MFFRVDDVFFNKALSVSVLRDRLENANFQKLSDAEIISAVTDSIKVLVYKINTSAAANSSREQSFDNAWKERHRPNGNVTLAFAACAAGDNKGASCRIDKWRGEITQLRLAISPWARFICQLQQRCKLTRANSARAA